MTHTCGKIIIKDAGIVTCNLIIVAVGLAPMILWSTMQLNDYTLLIYPAFGLIAWGVSVFKRCNAAHKQSN